MKIMKKIVNKINEIQKDVIGIEQLDKFSEGLLEKVKNKLAKKLSKVETTTTNEQAYIKQQNGFQSMLDISKDSPEPLSIVQRSEQGGRIVVGEPTADSHAATKKYVDEHGGNVDKYLKTIEQNEDNFTITDNEDNKTGFVDGSNRVEKISGPYPFDQAYIYDHGTGENTTYPIAMGSAAAETLARRNSNGQIFTGEPTEDSHAATKKYVDEQGGGGEPEQYVKDFSYDPVYGSYKFEDNKGDTVNVVVNKHGIRGAVYTVDENDMDSRLPYSKENTNNSIAQRQANGALSVSDPVNDTDAANKNYVNEEISKNNDTLIEKIEEDVDTRWSADGTGTHQAQPETLNFILDDGTEKTIQILEVVE